jgi:hypothetical protein
MCTHKKTSKREKRVKIDWRERQTEDRKTRMHIFFLCVCERERGRERVRESFQTPGECEEQIEKTNRN